MNDTASNRFGQEFPEEMTFKLRMKPLQILIKLGGEQKGRSLQTEETYEDQKVQKYLMCVRN